MGAWGFRIFESDAALDWANELCASGGLSRALRTLIRSDRNEVIGHEQRGEEILIAAELLIAISTEHPLPTFPARLAPLIDAENQNDDLFHETRNLVTPCCAKLARVRDGHGGYAALFANKQGVVPQNGWTTSMNCFGISPLNPNELSGRFAHFVDRQSP